jgi:predicted metal-dependent phosphoesterase TrpH
VSAPLNIDLHTHSNFSDGALTPAELVAHAAAAGVHILALTDHDSVAGLEAARTAAHELGIGLVPGVEISSSWRAQAIHVIGLWIDPAGPALCAMLRAQVDKRRARMRAICARLDKVRLPGDALLAAVEAQPGIPTRAHLALAMVAAGHVERIDEAFRRYLNKGKPGHAPVEWPALPEVIGAIVGAGGVAVLAHPGRYPLSGGARQRLLADFAAAGGSALEIISGGNGAQHVEASTALALKYGLTGSVGSDFHSPLAAWNPLGRSRELPDCITPVWRGLLP